MNEKKITKRSEICSSFPQMFKDLCSGRYNFALKYQVCLGDGEESLQKHKLPSHELVAKIWNLMLLCQPYRMLDSSRFGQKDHLVKFGESTPESFRYSTVVQ